MWMFLGAPLSQNKSDNALADMPLAAIKSIVEIE
jgi:hypothetical protein